MSVIEEFARDYKFYWHNVGIVGQSRTGKSHISTALLRRAMKRCSVLAPNKDAYDQYKHVSKDIKIVRDVDYNAKAVDNFIESRKDLGVRQRKLEKSDNTGWCLCLDDVDFLVNYAGESRWLDRITKVNQGHWYEGCIWQARRVKNLPYSLYQNSNYMIFAYGVDERDYDSLVEYTHLDLALYKSMKPPVRNAKDQNKIDYSEFLLLNTSTREQAIFSGVQ